MSIKNQIEQLIGGALDSLGLPQVEFGLEHPADTTHGDYSTNVAMVLWSVVRSPKSEVRSQQTGSQLEHETTSQLGGRGAGDVSGKTDPSLTLRMTKDGISSQSWKSPRELASKIVEEILKPSFALSSSGRARQVQDDEYSLIARVEVAGPGFINFFLSEEFLAGEMKRVLADGYGYGRQQADEHKKIVVEYTDPNPFKEFHVGHLYSNIVGESIARLLEAGGAKVWRGDYFGDVGMHVAKALWGIIRMAESEVRSPQTDEIKSVKVLMDELAQRPLKERIEFFGKAYSTGASAYEEDETAKEEMKQINFLAFKAAQEVVLPGFGVEARVDYDRFIKPGKYSYEEIRDLYAIGRSWSLEYFETIYARLGTKFDGYYPESMTGEYGYGMVEDGLAKGIFEKGEGGAVIFPGEKHGLHNRVFINALGLPTYECKDFGNAVAKEKDFPYTESVIVTGNEINEYFEVVLCAMRLYRPDLGEKTRHIGHGMVRLPEGKMSSRTGKIVRGEDVLEEAKARVVKVMEERESEVRSPKSEVPPLLWRTADGQRRSSEAGNSDAREATDPSLTLRMTEDIAEVVAQGAIKYAFLKQGIGKDISFDFDSSLSFEGNSGPYLQYTVVRAKSVLEKANSSYSVYRSPESGFNPEERVLLRWLYRYPEVVGQAAAEYAPHYVATYLYELAGRFNGFYHDHTISGVEGEQKAFRLALTASVAMILENGLKLLGIGVPARM